MESNFAYWDSTKNGLPKRKKLKKVDASIIDTAIKNNIWLSFDGTKSPDIGEFCYFTGKTLSYECVGLVTDYYYIGDSDYRWTQITLLNGKIHNEHAWAVVCISEEAIKELVEYFKVVGKIVNDKFNEQCLKLVGHTI